MKSLGVPSLIHGKKGERMSKTKEFMVRRGQTVVIEGVTYSFGWKATNDFNKWLERRGRRTNRGCPRRRISLFPTDGVSRAFWPEEILVALEAVGI